MLRLSKADACIVIARRVSTVNIRWADNTVTTNGDADDAHGVAEQYLQESGLDWTVLRPAYFMQNLLQFAPAIAATGRFHLPLGAGYTGMIDVRDGGVMLETEPAGPRMVQVKLRSSSTTPTSASRKS